MERRAGLWRVEIRGHAERHRGEVRVVVTGIGVLEVEEAPHHHRCTAEQHERQRDLGHDERTAQPATAWSADPASALLQHSHQIDPHRRQHRCDAEHDPGADRKARREPEDASIEGPVRRNAGGTAPNAEAIARKPT